MTSEIRIGTAGWSIPASCKAEFAVGASVLHRYDSRLNTVEIDSSFYRPHQKKTYERWADSVGKDFRFAVKAPKTITHELRLSNCRQQVAEFANEIAGLGPRLGVMLVQLPPALVFKEDVACKFFTMLTQHVSVLIACEPRHLSWFGHEASDTLERFGVARVEADPSIAAQPEDVGASAPFVYFRLHGTPKIYDSAYNADVLATYANRMAACLKAGKPTWCIFDNTMHGAATANALQLAALME